MYGFILGKETIPLNIAPHGVASQSSTKFNTQRFYPDEAQYAIDWDFATDMFPSTSADVVESKAAKCARTNTEAGAWWQLDLHHEYVVRRVVITTTEHEGEIV